MADIVLILYNYVHWIALHIYRTKVMCNPSTSSMS